MDDTYRSLAGSSRADLKVKGSRFLAEAVEVADADAAEAHIAAVRKREYNATHHCTAYRAGPDGATFRFNDDGEPSGTAGAPILRQIDGRELTNTLVIVTRYYGGTKLGTGGLIRAYGDAASLALDAGRIQTHTLRTLITVRFAYPDTSPAMHVIGQFDAEIRDTAYSEDTSITLAVRRSEADTFAEAFIQGLHGRGTVLPAPEQT